MANGVKIFVHRGICNNVSEVGERKAITAFDFVTPLWGIFKPAAINPGDGGCHRGKIDMVYDSMSITGLAFTTADVLFDFLKT